MRKLLSIVRAMPGLLVAVLAIFVSLPLWSLTFLPAPWRLFSALAPAEAALALFCYWLGPIALAVLIPRRSRAFLPLFYAECIAFVASAALQHAAPAIVAVRYLAIIVMAISGFLLLNKDLYFPFLTRSARARFWRLSSRVPAQAFVQLGVAGREKRVSVMIEDASATGMAVASSPETLDEILGPLAKGGRVFVRIKSRSRDLMLDFRVAWRHELGPIARLGLQAFDERAMGVLLDALASHDASNAMPSPWARIWVQSRFQRLLAFVLIGSIAFSSMLPACGTTDQPSLRTGSSTAGGKRPGAGDAGRQKDQDEDEDEGSGKGSDKGSGKGSGSGSRKKDDKKDDDQGSGSGSSSKTGDPNEDETANDDKPVDPASPPTPPAPVVYPTLKFLGKGYSTYKLDDQLATRMEVSIKADTTALHAVTTAAKVECGSKSGCRQDEVDAQVNKSSLGENLFGRVSGDELKALKASGFRNEGGLLFAKNLKAKNGKTFTVNPPIPVYAWPTKEDQYDSFAGGASWSAQVVSDQPIVTQPGLDDEDAPSLPLPGMFSITTFSVTVTAKSQSAGPGIVAVTLDVTIPEDSERMVYEAFNLPKTATYYVDTKAKNVVRTDATAWFNGSRSHQAEEMVLTYKLCAKDTAGKVENFPCE